MGTKQRLQQGWMGTSTHCLGHVWYLMLLDDGLRLWELLAQYMCWELVRAAERSCKLTFAITSVAWSIIIFA